MRRFIHLSFSMCLKINHLISNAIHQKTKGKWRKWYCEDKSAITLFKNSNKKKNLYSKPLS